MKSKLTIEKLATLLAASIILTSSADADTGYVSCPQNLAGFHNLIFVAPDWSEYKCEDFKAIDVLWGKVVRELRLSIEPIPIAAHRPPVDGIEGVSDTGAYMRLGFDPQNPVQVTGALLAVPHEMGHLVLDAVLRQRIPLLKEMEDLRNNEIRFWQLQINLSQIFYGFRSDQISEELLAKMRVLIGNTPPEVLHQYDALTEYRNTHKAEFDFVFDTVGGPFHELFADTVAAVYFEDPTVNQRMVEAFGEKDRKCRSFDALPVDFENPEVHCSLSSIRNMFWNQWVLPRMENKPALIIELTQIFSDEILNQLVLQRGNSKFNSSLAVSSLKKHLGLK